MNYDNIYSFISFYFLMPAGLHHSRIDFSSNVYIYLYIKETIATPILTKISHIWSLINIVLVVFELHLRTTFHPREQDHTGASTSRTSTTHEHMNTLLRFAELTIKAMHCSLAPPCEICEWHLISFSCSSFSPSGWCGKICSSRVSL